MSPVREKLVVNVGCGPDRTLTRSALFANWRHLRVDIDESVDPDVVANLTDLSPIRDNIADAVWSSHCVEHLYRHQVRSAVDEFCRIVAYDGFMVMLVPDLQAVAQKVVDDQFDEPIYDAPAGSVSAHDMFYGFGVAIAEGHPSMAHKCGFTPSSLVKLMDESRFAEYAIRRLPTLELAVVARKTLGTQETNCEALLQALNL